MKRNTILKLFRIIILFFLIGVSGVNGASTLLNNQTAYYKLDESAGATASDEVGLYNATLTGSYVWNTSGKINNALTFQTDGKADTGTTFFDDTDDFSFSTWLYWDGTASNSYFLTQRNSFTTMDYQFMLLSNGSLYSSIGESGATVNYWQVISSGQWYHYVLTKNGTTYTVYLDNVPKTHTIAQTWTKSDDFVFGNMKQVTSGNQMKGSMDELGVWSRALTPTEVTELYNNDNGNQRPYTQPEILFQNITVNGNTLINNTYFNISQLNFTTILSTSNTNNNTNQTFYLYNSTDILINTTQYATNNLTGLFTLNLTDGQYSIKFFAENNQTNVTSDLFFYVIDNFAPNISVNSFTEWNNGYNVTSLNSTLNITCSDPNLANCIIYWDDSTSTNILTTQHKLFTTNGNHSFNLTATDLANNSISVSGTIFINPYQYFRLFNLYDSTNVTNFTIQINDNINYSTTDGQIEIEVFDFILNQNNTIKINTIGFQQAIYTYYISNTSELNVTLNSSTALLFLEFRDIDTRNLITSLVEFSISGDSYSELYNTTTGLINISDIAALPDTYELISQSIGYEQNSRFFDFNGLDNVNITIYMSNSSSTTDITIIVRDNLLETLEGISVKIKVFDFVSNSYIDLIEKETNSVGQAIFGLNLNDKYQFVLSDGVNTVTKQGQYITATPLYLTFDPTTSRITIPNDYTIFGDIYFINTTQNRSRGYFGFVYNDNSNVLSQACINVYLRNYNEEVLINTTCSNLASATIYSDILDISFGDTYIIKGTGVYDGSNILIYEESFIFSSVYSDDAWKYGVGLFFSIMLFLLLVKGGMQSQLHPLVLAILSIVPLLIGSIFGSLPIKIGSIVTFGGLFLYIVFFRRRS